MTRLFGALLLSCAVAGCRTPAEPRNVTAERPVAQAPADRASPASDAGSRPSGGAALQRSASPAPGEPGGLPSDPVPLAEGPIDPKSVEAAAQAVQRFFALVEAGRTVEAARSWTSPDTAAAFDRRFPGASVHAEVGRPSDPESAAGSTFVTVPVRIYGTDADGRVFSRLATATVRRVNDVPGATAEQLRWRIISILP